MNTNAKSMQGLLSLLWAIAMILTIILYLTGCSKAPEQANGTSTAVPPRAVEVERPVVHDVAEQYLVSGRVVNSEEARLSFKTGGYVHRLLVDAGDRFERGDLIAVLDTTEVAAAVLDIVEQRKQAERNFDRMRRLYADSVATLQQFQDAEAMLTRARAGEERALYNLQNSVIHAPFDGVVSMRLANEGEMWEAGRPVYRVVSFEQPYRVQVGVPARFIHVLRNGQTMRVEVESIEQILQGQVVLTGATADPYTGNFPVEVELPSHRRMREGLIAMVRFEGPAEPALVLPGGVLAQGDEDRGYVYLVQDGRAIRTEVTILDIRGDSLVIAPGLPDGCAIVKSGAGLLTDGEVVEVVEAMP